MPDIKSHDEYRAHLDSLDLARTLREAAGYLDKHGWSKGSGWDYENESKVCLEGAIVAVIGIPMYFKELDEGGQTHRVENTQYMYAFHTSALHHHLVQHLRETGRLRLADLPGAQKDLLWQWNDRYAESKSQVLDVLNETADKIESETP